MLERAVDVRLATEGELEAVTALLVAQLREHRRRAGGRLILGR